MSMTAHYCINCPRCKSGCSICRRCRCSDAELDAVLKPYEFLTVTPFQSLVVAPSVPTENTERDWDEEQRPETD